MPITRTPLIDDDGSGSTGTILNNAWQNGLYNAIDAAIEPRYGTWTPTDNSGAGLVFLSAIGTWAKYGRIVFLAAQVVYPTTANTAAVYIGGWSSVGSPSGAAGLAHGQGPFTVYYIDPNSGLILFLDSNGTQKTNIMMSGANITFSGSYLAIA